MVKNLRRKKIVRLDRETIKRIAAGEVVSRPASVVKELIENSLDARAERISVNILNGGKDLIEVVDDGIGIPSHEVELALELHTTSKIYEPDDLRSIATYGFRGEALASIAAVSILEISTRSSEEARGTYLLTEGGKIIERKTIDRTPGTTIRVRNLFFNTPARRKFLKSDVIEKKHVISVVTKIALANAEKHFTLLANGKPIIRAPARNTIRERIFDLFGPKIANNFLELNAHPIFSGFITQPHYYSRDRSLQFAFVNGRPVNSTLLGTAVKTGYGTLLMTRQHPGFIIYVNIDPETVDVNIHPAKLEIRFQDEEMLASELRKLVKLTISEKAEMDQVRSEIIPKPQVSNTSHEEPDVQARATDPMVFERTAVQSRLTDVSPQLPIPSFHSSIGEMRLLGQVFKKYFLAETEGELVLIDMHAVHERVNYEKNLQALAKDHERQSLLSPLRVELPPSIIARIEENTEFLESMGFRFGSRGSSFIELTSVPHIMSGVSNTEKLVSILLDMLKNAEDLLGAEEHSSLSAKDLMYHALAAQIACHGSLRAGDEPNLAYFAGILRNLSKCKNQLSCPHGRPVLIRFPESWLDKQFKRIVT